METDDVPLLTLGPIAEDFQYAQFLHGIWMNDAQQQSYSEVEGVDELQRASSLKSNFSQEPSLQLSQPLSQILDPVEERQKVSRQEAFDLLRQVSSSAEAAQRALEKVTGDEFLDASGEELEARDDLLEKIRKMMIEGGQHAAPLTRINKAAVAGSGLVHPQLPCCCSQR